MILTLSGDNTFLLKRELSQLVADFTSTYGDLSLEQLDGEETDILKIRESITSLGFLTPKKMVVIKEASKNKDFTEQIEELLSLVPDSTDVILIETKIDKRLGAYKYLKNKTDFKEFKSLDTPKLIQWLVEKAKENDGSISTGDAKYLIERAGSNQLLLDNELDKLLLYEPNVSRKSIDLLVEQTPQSTIFQLLDAAFSGRINRTMGLYHEQRELKREPQEIIAMLTWQLSILAIVKVSGDRSPAQVAKEAKIHPFTLSKSQQISQKLTLSKLRRLINELLQLDLSAKTKSIDLDEALQQYLLGLAL